MHTPFHFAHMSINSTLNKKNVPTATTPSLNLDALASSFQKMFDGVAILVPIKKFVPPFNFNVRADLT
jgi:hypothetical protein